MAEVSASWRTGCSAGLTFLMDGGDGMFCGNSRLACVIAFCTSWAAPSILRFRLNCSVMRVLPSVFCETIESRPAIVENCFSSGKATAAPIVSGFAPGRLAWTWMVG